MQFLDKQIDENVKKGIYPGMVYGIVKDNKTIIGGSGYKMLVPKIQKLDINALYDVNALTKVIVTVPIICKLISEGKLHFHDKVIKYLPNFKYRNIEIIHLLAHISGLPSDIHSNIFSKEDLINKLYNTNIEYEPETKVVYSDLGYILLGKIIKNIYEKPLDVVAKEEIFDPLEMTQTCFNPQNKNNCAPTKTNENYHSIQGIVRDDKAYYLNGISGHSGIFTTAGDLTNFISMILNDGIYNNQKVLSKNMIDLWFKNIVYDNKYDWTRSFSWVTGTNNLSMEERKNTIAFSSFTGPSIIIDRDNKIGIALLTNCIHSSCNNKLLCDERPNMTEEIYKHLVKTK